MGCDCDILSREFIADSMARFSFPETAKKRATENFEKHDREPERGAGEFSSFVRDTKKGTLPASVHRNVDQLLVAYQDEMDQSIERRVALLFQQTMLCYQMPFHFKDGAAQDQYGRGCQAPYKYAAAHPSTLPCLLATLRADKKAAKLTDQAVPYFTYLKYSSAYQAHNSTIEVPEIINKADSALDFQVGEKAATLRGKSIKIINRCAKGEFEPREATRQFVAEMESCLCNLIETLGEGDARVKVLRCYLSCVQEISIKLHSGNQIFDHLIGIKIDPDDVDGDLIREIVIKPRYDILTAAQAIESRIAKRIFDFIRLSPAKETAVKCQFALIRRASDQEKVILRRLFSKSTAYLEAPISTQQQLYARDVASYEAQNKIKLNNLMRDIRADTFELHRIEQSFRSAILKGLRVNLRDMTQNQFAEMFKILYPGEPMSQSMVSRLEQRVSAVQKAVYQTPLNQRRKDVSIENAIKYAATLRVDPGVFMPGLFTSAFQEENGWSHDFDLPDHE